MDGARVPRAAVGRGPVKRRLLQGLASCATEADVVQILYAELHPEFGYDIINLQVLEREGWYHSNAIDRGVLQDVRRRLLATSNFAEFYRQPRTVAGYATPATIFERGRGPGRAKHPQTLIWVPILHHGEPIGAVVYQLYERREVPAREIALLESVHAHLGPIVSNAYLNELSRNQSVSLRALNAIAKALSSTRDEVAVVTALRETLSPLLPIDELQLAVPSDVGPSSSQSAWPALAMAGQISASAELALPPADALPQTSVLRSSDPRATLRRARETRRRPVRLLRSRRGGELLVDELPPELPELRAVQRVMRARRSELVTGQRLGSYESAALVPVLEGEHLTAVLSLLSHEPGVYEQSTLTFLEQVGDSVALALRNAWSYAAVEAQRRSLEVTNAALDSQRRRLEVTNLALKAQRRRLSVVNLVGRRLASCLDRRSIIYTLRRELSRHLDFDLLCLATIREGPDGPKAEAYVYDSGQERSLPPLQMAAAGPSREAYETGRAIHVKSSPWAENLELNRGFDQSRVFGEGAVLDVTQPATGGPVAARSIIWVPVRRGSRVTALLSLQSYRANAFDDHHVQLVQDVAAHVSLALSTAEHFHAAEVERRRLEALHVLEAGVAVAGDEREVAEAVFDAIRGSMQTSNLLLVFLDARGHATGYGMEAGRSIELPPKPVERTTHFRRVLEERRTVVAATPREQRQSHPGVGWPTEDPRLPAHVVWVPVALGDRVVGAMSAQRYEEVPFTEEEVELLESAAPAVGIALRTVRLHRANELALSHSVRMQELASLAGHDLASVVSSVAEQARDTLEAAGAACWVMNDEGRVAASAVSGDNVASQVLAWSRRGFVNGPGHVPDRPLSGGRQRSVWTLLPLRYADRVVGALGFVHPAGGFDDLISAPEEFVRHAAIAIENARLAAETWDRIHTLEAVAAFADLDISRPEGARREMGRQVERALAGSHGALWLVEAGALVRASDPAERLALALHGVRGRRPLISAARRVLSAGRRPDHVLIAPVLVEGEPAGMVSAEATGSSPGETRRLIKVLASQAGLVLGRLRLVGALGHQARTTEAILRHSPVGVVLEAADGKVLYANPVIERIYGVRARKLIGQPAAELLAQAQATVVTDPDARPSGPVELRLGEKGEKVVHVRRVPVPGSPGEPEGVLSLHEDVTEERAVLDAKDLMLRAIGHEVRSPAAAMRATIASLLQWDEHMEPTQRRLLLEDAYEQSERLLNLVEAQLIISKLEAGGFEPRPVPVLLPEVATQVQRVLGNRYGSRVEAVEFRLPDLPPASCEPTHLEQALTNLIGNALEHAWAEQILVTARHRGEWFEVTVEDNGRGLPQERVAALFSRSPAGQHRARGGLGLGLYLCRLIVERSFGGRVWLERTSSTGSVFKFTVPALGRERRRGATAGDSGTGLVPTDPRNR